MPNIRQSGRRVRAAVGAAAMAACIAGSDSRVLIWAARPAAVVAEDRYHPGVAARQGSGLRVAGTARTRGARLRHCAGGEVGKEAGQALAGAGNAGPERQGERAEAAELGGDQQKQPAKDDVQAGGDVTDGVRVHRVGGGGMPSWGG